jgi:ATP-dependent 26S proteasome regulatory subunit
LFCAATTDAFRDELLDTIESLALGECSTWRGQAVQIDPAEPRGFTHLIPHQPEPPAATLADGLRRNLVVPLRQFETLGAHVPRRGVLLHGRPGTGKSWAIGWVISQVLGPVSVIVATPSVVGNGPFMRGAFEMAATAAPALLVLEDLDVGAGHRMLSASAFGEILNAMDGPGRLPGVFVAATTNHLELLDPALSQRPGRFDVTLEAVEAPDDVRRRAVEAIAAELGVPDDEVTDVVARTKGYSMAEIAAIGQMAWLVAADTGEAPSLTTALTTLAAESPMVVADRLESGYV